VVFFRGGFLVSTKVEGGSDQIVFRKTHGYTGRRVSVTPGNSAMGHLAYGRIILNATAPAESLSTGERETGLIVLSGNATVTDDRGQEVSLGQYDAIYIPRDSSVKIATTSNADIAEFSAEVSKRYPFQVVRFSQVENDLGLKFTTGGSGSLGKLHRLLAKNVEAGRLVAAFTISEPGNWTSWPPHEHAKMLEEMYLYFDMPDLHFGIPLVYNRTDYPEMVTVVRDGDAVLMPSGYHPNVSVPGHRICFLWAMAAHREGADRQFGVVNVQRELDQESFGLEAGPKK
jgi:5-deoxy-glucuronate isomerase